MKSIPLPTLRFTLPGAALLALASAASAASYTWNGASVTSGSTYNWNNTANWLGGSIAASGTDTVLYFNTGATSSGSTVTFSNDLASPPFQLNKIWVQVASGVGGFVTTGNQLQFMDNGLTAPSIVIDNIVTSFSLNNNILLNTNLQVTGTFSGGSSTTIAGLISGTGSIALNTTASPTVVFSTTTSTFSGGVTLSNCQLALGASSVGSPGSVTSGPVGTGTLTLNGGIVRTTSGGSRTINNALSIGGNVQLGASGATTVLTYGGTTTLIGTGVTRTLTLGASAVTGTAAVFGESIRDGGNGNGITILGTGILEMSGSTANTYTGLTTVNSASATLKLNKSASINAVAGNLTITSGTVRLAQANQIADSSNITLNGVLDLNGNSETVGSLLASSGSIVNGGAAAAILTLGGTGSGTFNGGIKDGAGTLALVKQGSDQLVLTGSCSYSGGLTVTNGQLVIGTASAAGTGTITLNGGTFRSTNGFTTGTLGNAIQIAGNAQIGQGSTSYLTLVGQTTLTGSGTTRTVSLGANSGTGTAVIFAGSIGDGGNANGMLVNGSGVLEMSGTAANTYTGVTTVWSGATILKLNKTGATAIAGGLTITQGSVVLAQANQIADTSSLIVNGVLDLNGNSETVGSLVSGTGTITSGTTGAVTLTLGAAANGNFSGIIQDGLGTIAIVKQGSGSLVLNNNNTFSGGLALNSGTLGIFTGNGLGTAPASGTNLVFTGNSALQFQGGTGGTNVAANRGFVINPGVSATIDTQNYTDVLDNSISGAGSLTKTGAGTLVLNGSSSYSGGTLVSSGTVSFTNLNALSSGTITVSGSSTLLMAVTGTFANNVTINSGATATINPSTGNSTFSGTISGSGALARSGTNILTLSASNSYTGGTVLTGAGNLDLGASGALGNGALTLGDGADTGNVRLELNGFNQTVTGLYFGMQSGHAAVIQNQGSGLSVLTIALASGTNSSTSSLYFRDTGGGTTGSLALVKTGAGTLDFSNYATMGYSGGLTVNGGVFAFSNGAALGSGTITLGSGTLAVTSGSSVTSSNPTTLASNLGGIDTGSGTATFSGVISGTGALMKYGSGTLTLSGSNTFSGDAVVNAGTLILAGSQALAGSAFDTMSVGTLSFGALTAATFGALKNSGSLVLSNTAGAAVALSLGGNNRSSSYAGSLSGPGSLAKVGSGTLTLTGSQAYTGLTSVNGGTLQIGDGVTDASIASSSGIVNNASLAWNLVASQSYAVAISGTGALTKNGNTLTLTGSSAYTGAITIGSGTLQLGDGIGGSLAGGSITLSPGTTLNINLPDGGTVGSSIYTYGNNVNLLAGGANTITGQIYGYVSGAVNQTGTGTTILTGNNDFAGTINIEAGAVQLKGAFSAYKSTVNVDVENGLAFGVNSTSVGALSGSASFALLNGTNGVTLNVGGNNANSTYGGSISGSSGTSSLIKSGSGTLTLTGSSTYGGSTTISAGTLQLGDGTSGHDGSLSTSAITNNGTLVYDLAGSETVAYPINGSGSVIKTGSGMLTLAGNSGFTGPMAIASGTVTLTSGTLINLSTSSVMIASGARMVVNNNNSNSVYTPANSILTVQSGATLTENAPTFVTGYLVAPTGAIIDGTYATVSLLGADTDTQKTAGFGSVNMGRILDGLSASGTQTLQFDGTGTGANIGTVSMRPNTAGAYIHNMDIAHSPTAANGVDVTVPLLEVRPSSGIFAFNKLGAGVLQINGFLFNGSAPYTNNPVSCKVAAGTLILNTSGTNGNGVNFASLTVDNGATLQVGASGTVGAVYTDIVDNGNVNFKRSDACTYSNAISGSGGVTQFGTGTLTLNGSNTYSGGTTLNAGTLNFGNADALGSGTAVFTGGATLQAGVTDTVANAIAINSGVTGTIDTGTNTVTLSGNITGQGQLLKAGVNGVLYLSGSNTYSGGTVIESASVANIPVYGALGVVLLSHNALGTGPLTMGDANTSGGARLELNGFNQTVSALSSGSMGVLILEANGTAGGSVSTLTVNQNINTAYTGYLRDTFSGGGLLALVKTGSGLLDLSGANSGGQYGGGLTVNGGILGFALASQVGNGSISLGDGTLRYTPAASSGTLGNAIGLTATTASVIEVTNGGSALAITGVLSGSGALTKSGSGMLTLGSNNTCTGTITIGAGTLQIGNGTDAGSIFYAAAVVNNGALVYNVGGSTRTLGAVISGTGSLTQNSTGKLTLTGNNTYTGATTINSGTLTIGGAGSLGSGSYAGNIANGGVFDYDSAASLTLSGLISGSGALVKTGAGTLTVSASNSYTGGTILSGGNNTELGANSALGNGPLTLGDGNMFFNVRLRLNGHSQTITGLSISNAFPSVIENEGGGAGVLTVNLASGTNSSTSNFYFRDASGGTGTLALVKTGNGTLDFSTYATMNYSGGLTVNAGTLAFNNAAALGAGSITLGGGTLAVTSGSSVTISNATTLKAATISAIDTGTGTVTHSGIVSGAGSLAKVGPGTLTLSGSNNYSGGTTVSNGSLQVGNDNALGTGGLTVNGGTLDLSGHNVSIPSFSGSGGTITNTVSGTSVITASIVSGTSTYSGNITDGTGAVVLTKVGPGKLILSGSLSMTGLNATSGVAELAQSGHIGAVTISGSGAVTMTAHSGGAYKVLDTNSLSISAGGSVDLWNNAMILRASGTAENAANLTAVKAAVNAASNGLQWNGVGIGSTTAYNEAQPGKTQALAIMVYDNTVISQSSFEGVTGLGYFDGGNNPVGFNQVLVKLTYLGDFNADGVVNASDYTWLDGFALGANPLGDLNGDGVVNATDYTWLDGSALNQSFGVLAGNGSGFTPVQTPVVASAPAGPNSLAASPEAVPEPGTFGMLLTGALAMLGCRRRQTGKGRPAKE